MKNTEHPLAIDRRDFIRSSLGAAALGLGGTLPARAAPSVPLPQPAGGLIDVNVNLERWPFRRLYRDDVSHLVEKLRGAGVTEAWAGSFDGIFHKDIAAVNERLAESCRRDGQGILVPFGAVNPIWPEWEEDVRRCHEVFRMPGIRLHPSYHGYTLNDDRFARVLRSAADRGLVVQLAAAMEDERTQHPLVHTPTVNTASLAGIAATIPGLKLIVLNTGRIGREPAGESKVRPAGTGRLFHDISWLEGSECIGELLQDNPAAASQTLFGSHAPLFPIESALLKLQESALTPAQLRGIASANARRLLPKV